MGTCRPTIRQVKAMGLRPCSACMLLLFSYQTPRQVQVLHQVLHSRDFSLYSTPQQPAEMRSAHSPVHHRPSSISHHHNLTNYSHSTDPYGSVKVEDEHYASSNHHHHHPNSHSTHYSLPSFSHTTSQHDIDSWHAYSSERAPLHR